MRFKLKIFTNIIIIIFFSFETLEIKAHNKSNGGCQDHCFNIIYRKFNESKIKVFKNNIKLIRDKNSCVKNSLCRG